MIGLFRAFTGNKKARSCSFGASMLLVGASVYLTPSSAFLVPATSAAYGMGAISQNVESQPAAGAPGDRIRLAQGPLLPIEEKLAVDCAKWILKAVCEEVVVNELKKVCKWICEAGPLDPNLGPFPKPEPGKPQTQPQCKNKKEVCETIKIPVKQKKCTQQRVCVERKKPSAPDKPKPPEKPKPAKPQPPEKPKPGKPKPGEKQKE